MLAEWESPRPSTLLVVEFLELGRSLRSRSTLHVAHASFCQAGAAEQFSLPVSPPEVTASPPRQPSSPIEMCPDKYVRPDESQLVEDDRG